MSLFSQVAVAHVNNFFKKIKKNQLYVSTNIFNGKSNNISSGDRVEILRQCLKLASSSDNPDSIK